MLALHVGVLASYAGLALILTLPLALRFTTHVPGDGIDDPALTWNLWWVWDSALHGRDLFHCDYMFHPIRINLAFYTLTVLNGFLSGPLQAIFGLVPASNLILLSSYVLGGYGAFLLTLRLLGPVDRRWAVSAAWFAGLAYAFAAPKLFYAALGQFNIASSQWVPFAVLSLWEAIRGRWRQAGLAGLFLGMQAWAEMTYASFLLVFLGLLVAWRVAETLAGRNTWSAFLRRTLLPVALAGGLFVAIIAPILGSMALDLAVEGDFTVVGGGFADVFSADVAGLIAPTMLHPGLGSLVSEWMEVRHFDKGQHLYYGLSLWVLAAVALAGTRNGRPAFWGTAAVVFLLLAFGPVLQVNGSEFHLPMPFSVLQELPLFKANRYPSRFGVMLGLSLAVLGGMGVAHLMRRLPRRQWWLLGGLTLLFLGENLSAPLPLSDMRVPSLYRLIREEPGDFAVLELPLGWRNGFRVTGAQHVGIMFSQFYQTAHGKRLLGGNTSRNPELKFQYFAEMPVLESLVALQTGRGLPTDAWEHDRALAGRVLAALGVRYVVTHTPPVDGPLRQYVEEVLPTRLVAEQEGMRVYAVQSDSGLGPLDLRVALAEGWGSRRAPAPAVRSRARLLVPGGDVRHLTLEVRGLGTGDAVAVEAGGRLVGECQLTDEWSKCQVSLPPESAPVQQVLLLGARRRDPRSLPAVRAIGNTGVQAPVDLYVRSAGEEFGDFGRVYVGGREASPNGRGYNLVALDAVSGEIISRRSFDTHADPQASSEMSAYLESLPWGTIVAGAVADEASLNLSQEAVGALGRLGLEADLRGCFRCAHAFVGVVGAETGTAEESWGDIGVQEVIVGRGVSEPAVYFELRSLAVDPGGQSSGARRR
ncbi:MAG: hypothetical protein HPY83_04235 [Anaerolineae bacterium]|nr:hypothetical protein [Anaerolineae bacterium]